MQNALGNTNTGSGGAVKGYWFFVEENRVGKGRREGWKEGERGAEGGRVGGSERGAEGGRAGGREGQREGGMEGGREGGLEGVREGGREELAEERVRDTELRELLVLNTGRKQRAREQTCDPMCTNQKKCSRCIVSLSR